MWLWLCRRAIDGNSAVYGISGANLTMPASGIHVLLPLTPSSQPFPPPAPLRPLRPLLPHMARLLAACAALCAAIAAVASAHSTVLYPRSAASGIYAMGTIGGRPAVCLPRLF